jgi:U2-associated protein SR140
LALVRLQRADAEAAKLYEEFVVSFQAEDEGGLKTFVRGEVVEPGSRPSDAKSSKGGKYVPSFVPPGMAEAMAAKSSRKDDPKAMFLPPSSKPDKGKPRAIDMVLEEMKR